MLLELGCIRYVAACPSLRPGRNAVVKQLGTFVVPDESTFYGISRDFYKYEETRLAQALTRSILPECIRVESLFEVVMLRFVSKSDTLWGSASAMNFKRIKNHNKTHT